MRKDNIYIRVHTMDRTELMGRVKATVSYLTDFGRGYDHESTRVMRNILDGAETPDVYGRVCALIGYITGDVWHTDHEALVYEMITGEKLDETENKPIDAGTSTDSAE